MARILNNSKMVPRRGDGDNADMRAAARKHEIDDAFAASTGQAGLDQGDRAKRRLRRR